MKFTSLDVRNEEILRDMIHKMINQIEVHADGSIEISYNFQNPLRKEHSLKSASPFFPSILRTPHNLSVETGSYNQ